jgi:uncharacterized membrane protein YphA (DoxX/SURF4 family)
MAEVLTPIFATAALIVCLAGAAKLRSPDGATRALRTIGLPGNDLLVRALAVGEVALGLACVIDPRPALAVALACLYGVFAIVAYALVRERAGCGCFGEGDTPASVLQSAISVVLALGALLSAVWTPHGLAWVVDRSGATAAVLLVGIGGAVYASVMAYTVLPQAWGAWSGR